MGGMCMFSGLCEVLHQELKQMERKLTKGGSLNNQDLDAIDKLAHALKSIATYEAMEGSSEYSGDSYYNSGRSRMSGRYSRESGRQVEYGKESDPYYDRR